MPEYNLDPSAFKAYDIRGTYPEQVNEKLAYDVGRAFATFIGADTVVVGRDMRLSGPAMFEALAKGLMDQGVNVINVGMVSTDQYYFACTKLGHPGIMVTASHNPANYNGFKMVKKMPYLLSGDEGIQDIRKIIEAGSFAESKGQGQMTDQDLSDEFVDHVLGMVDINKIGNIKVIADTCNGMVGPILQKIFAKLPQIQFTGMYLEPDGSIPNHGLDPLDPDNRAELEKRVVEEGYDIGFAFDGDGDRFFTIDDRGQFVAGDYMTALLGQYMLEKYPSSNILYDVRASWAVPDLISQAGGTPLVERVGHSFIKSRMAKEDAVFAGEVSGHYYFKDFLFADSGVIPALIVLEMLSVKSQKLSEILLPLEQKYIISGEINSKISANPKDKMQEIADKYSDGKIEWIDGISVTYPDWHFNVRSSNTEPLMRLNLEAKSLEDMEKKRDELLAIIRG